MLGCCVQVVPRGSRMDPVTGLPFGNESGSGDGYGYGSGSGDGYGYGDGDGGGYGDGSWTDPYMPEEQP